MLRVEAFAPAWFEGPIYAANLTIAGHILGSREGPAEAGPDDDPGEPFASVEIPLTAAIARVAQHFEAGQ